MKLSVLIPAYNYDCTKLVSDLAKQLPDDAELIVADDGSTDANSLQQLEAINEIPHCRLIKFNENAGRSIIRNKLADASQGEWLLFLDCDAEVRSDKFIENYLNIKNADVICGGAMAPDRCPSPQVSLRYLYERDFWTKHLAYKRSLKPYENFTTFNFMIKRDLFMNIRFNEKITGYGYEDVMFGKELSKQNITIKHIDNQLTHIGLEPNDEFLNKTEESIRSLKEVASDIQGNSALLDTYNKIKSNSLAGVLRTFHDIFGDMERKHLLAPGPEIWIFKLYKLGYCAKVMQYAF